MSGLFVPFEGKPFFDLCTLCGKKISTRYAQARVSHARKHVRAGEATERVEGHWLSGKTVFDRAVASPDKGETSARPTTTEDET